MILLGIAAILSGPVAGYIGVRLAKKALPLKASLATLDPTALYPYRVIKRHILDPPMVDALGTEAYISWELEDTSLLPNDRHRFANLFVTYYSGGVDLVPHVPDVCYLGAGYQPRQAHENVEIDLRSLGSSSPIPVRVCTFGKTAIFDRAEQTVIYTFYCNGRFASTRSGVRLLINDLTDTYAFFSKAEVSFPGAGRKESIGLAQKLFDRVLPILIERHWPDFQQAEASAKQTK